MKIYSGSWNEWIGAANISLGTSIRWHWWFVCWQKIWLEPFSTCRLQCITHQTIVTLVPIFGWFFCISASLTRRRNHKKCKFFKCYDTIKAYMRQALRDCRKNCTRIHNSVNGFISRGTPIEADIYAYDLKQTHWFFIKISIYFRWSAIYKPKAHRHFYIPPSKPTLQPLMIEQCA